MSFLISLLSIFFSILLFPSLPSCFSIATRRAATGFNCPYLLPNTFYLRNTITSSLPYQKIRLIHKKFRAQIDSSIHSTSTAFSFVQILGSYSWFFSAAPTSPLGETITTALGKLIVIKCKSKDVISCKLIAPHGEVIKEGTNDCTSEIPFVRIRDVGIWNCLTTLPGKAEEFLTEFAVNGEHPYGKRKRS